MAPGPKPLSLARLKLYAWVAAKLFFAIRFGRNGRLCKRKPAPDFSEVHAEIIPASVSPAKVKETIEKLRELNRGDWVIEPWVSPELELWKQLRNARSEREVRQVAKNIARWEKSQGFGYTGSLDYDFPRALQFHAREFLEAKRLPEYPKSERPRSEEKRAWYLAKVLAGLTLGRSPLYTLKRLSGWRGEGFPKIEGEKR